MGGAGWRRRVAVTVVVLGVLVLLASSCTVNGTWTATTVAPPASSRVRFTDVSCPTTTFCAAVGAYSTGSGDGRAWATWNGTAWSVTQIPLSKISYEHVSCASTTRCFVSYTGKDFENLDYFGVDTWDGTTLTPAIRPIFGRPVLSCSTGGFCMALAGETTYTWNGSSFVLAASQPGQEYKALSCASSTFCLSVGADTSGPGGRFVSAWNGTSFTPVTTPAPPDRSEIRYEDVSCVSSSYCELVGRVVDSNTGTTFATAAARWNGSTLAAEALPDATAPLISVSCASRISCVALASPAGAVATDGGAWSASPAPTGASTYSAYYALDCTAASTSCMAVGAGVQPGWSYLASRYAWSY